MMMMMISLEKYSNLVDVPEHDQYSIVTLLLKRRGEN